MKRRIGTALLTLAPLACNPDGMSDSDYGTSALPAPPGADAQFVSSNIPFAMFPGENLNVTVTMRNTGTTTWDGDYRLHRVGDPMWNWVNTKVPGTATPGQSKPIRFVIRAPGASADPYTFRASMHNQGFFGQEVNLQPIFVSTSTPRRWGCNWDRNDPANVVPTTLTVGETFFAKFRIRNTGTNPWHRGEPRCEGDPINDRGTFLLSQDDKTAVGQFNFWGTNSTQIHISKDVTSNDFVDVIVPITANPNVQRTESFRFARQVYDCRPPNPDPNGGVGFLQGGNGVGNFDACIDVNITVTMCGNGVVDTSEGEECDDSNRASGDGCNEFCRFETTTATVDLRTDAVGRTFVGSQPLKQAGGVVHAAAQHILMGEIATVVPDIGAGRNVAGKIYGFSVSPSLLDGSVTRLPGGNPDFTFLGADADDMLGHVDGPIASGQMDGIGGQEVAISSIFADGVDNAVSNAGEVWVFSLDGLTGTVDLRTASTHANFRARVVGPAANARIRALGISRLGHLIVGSPGTNQVFVLRGTGGSALSGTIDLANPVGVDMDILNGNAGGNFGLVGAVAELSGDAHEDLVLTAPGFDRTGGLDDAGRVAIVFGPFNGGSTKNLGLRAGQSGGPNVLILGSTLNGRLGASLAIGNVRGGSQRELIIGEPNARKRGGNTAQFGRCLVVHGTGNGGDGFFINNTTIDLTLAPGNIRSVWARDANDLGGSSCAVGDVNFDGYKDVIMGAGGSDGPDGTRTQAGAVLVAVGSAAMTSIDFGVSAPAFEMHGRHQSAQLAVQPFSLASVDINGDEHEEIIAGSWQGANNLFPGVTRPGEVVLVDTGL